MFNDIQWTSRIYSPDGAYDYTVPASVPGCIHTDLQKAGILGNLFWRDNAESCQWIENCDMTCTGVFTLEEVPEKAALLFHGLDCYSTVSLNGVKLGETDNMFIPWRFAVDGVLKTGENVITVDFRSPVREVEGLPRRSAAFTAERLYTRRIQCTYGWDWVGRFVTMGIWRPVELVAEEADALAYNRLGTGNEGIYVWTKNVNPFGAQVGVNLRFLDVTGDGWVHLTIAAPDGKVVWAKKRRILSTVDPVFAEITETADIADPKLWYPAGYGDQPLYTLTCEVYNKEEKQIAEKVQTFGIRTVVILETEDAPESDWAKKAKKLKEYDHLVEWDRNEGSSRFCLLVNGVEIFCQGANWVPCEPFPSAETPDKIRRLVALAKAGGVNMLRVWGGGIFENDAFYTACDEAGILVTQDFLMACGTYPEEMLLGHLRKEALTAGLALRNHPSLVWWSGDNENAVAGDENMAHYSGRKAALEAIGPVLAVIDPERRFLPSSPYGGVPYASGVRGTSHNTQFLGSFFGWVRAADENLAAGVTRDEKGWSCYREYFDRYLDRFTAEQPAMGMPSVLSLRQFMTDEDIFGDDTYISEYHTKNNPGLGAITLYGYCDRLTKGIFGDYTSGADRVKKMQYLHCEWIRLSMELFRRNAWYSSGILYWMWNDCWPAANGWSIVDYYTMPKPGYFSFRRCAKPVIASVVPDEDGKTVVYLSHNGAGEAAKGHLRLYRYNLVTGAEDFETVVSVNQPAGVTRAVLSVPAVPLDRETVLLADVHTDCGDDRAFSLPPMHRYADMAFDLTAEPVVEFVDGGAKVTAQAAIPFVLFDTEDVYDGLGEFMKAGETQVLIKN
ncbi:MAG: hypothetical protein IKY52_03090 [Clostridia bacterium]|nr:hypothetical protein [Clostridia bacterium]